MPPSSLLYETLLNVLQHAPWRDRRHLLTLAWMVMGLRATARIRGTHKNTIAEWEGRFAGMKPTLMLYGLCHTFIPLTFEGDELYTVVGQRVPPADSTGWTAIILERASRFRVDQQGGGKDATLFKKSCDRWPPTSSRPRTRPFSPMGSAVMGTPCLNAVPRRCGPGNRAVPARRCQKAAGYASKTKAVNGIGAVPSARNSKHPNPSIPTPRATFPRRLHAHHLEGYNPALRRRNSAFRRRTNTDAKNANALQRTLDVHLLQHNFVRRHWTTGEVPAVRLGIMAAPLRLEEILMMPKAA